MLTYFCMFLCKSVSSPGLIIKNWKKKRMGRHVEISRLIICSVSSNHTLFRDVSPEIPFLDLELLQCWLENSSKTFTNLNSFRTFECF